MSAFFASPVTKFLVIAAGFALLYVLARLASKLNEVKAAELPISANRSQPPEKNLKVIPINQQREFRKPDDDVSEQALLPVRIVNLYFSGFDFIPGPPDPEVFADEIFVDLFDDNTGYRWTQSFFVASPRGIGEMLKRENWKYAFADTSIFVRRYSPQEIREAVVERLVQIQERPSPPREPEDRYI